MFNADAPLQTDADSNAARAADHNHLRLPSEAEILYDAISEYNSVFPERTKQFWREAISRV